MRLLQVPALPSAPALRACPTQVIRHFLETRRDPLAPPSLLYNGLFSVALRGWRVFPHPGNPSLPVTGAIQNGCGAVNLDALSCPFTKFLKKFPTFESCFFLQEVEIFGLLFLALTWAAEGSSVRPFPRNPRGRFRFSRRYFLPMSRFFKFFKLLFL